MSIRNGGEMLSTLGRTTGQWQESAVLLSPGRHGEHLDPV